MTSSRLQPALRPEVAANAAERAVRHLSVMTLGRAGTQMVLILSALLIPSVLGTEAFGRYATVMALVVTLEVLGSGGLHLAEVRYFAPAWRAKQEHAVLIGSSLWTARLVFSSLAAVVAAGWLLVSPNAGEDVVALVAVACLVGVRSALEATRQLFLSLGRVTTMAIFELVRATVTLLVVVATFDSVGLTGVFTTLAAAQGALLTAAIVTLRRAAPLTFTVDWGMLRPMLRFGAATLVGMLAWIVQAQIPVYAVGNWASLEEAAIVGVTVQIYVLGQTLLLSPWAAVLPILAELDVSGQQVRLREWGSMMMRWSTAASVVVTMGWALLGGTFLTPLPSSFAEVHLSGTVMLASLALLSSTIATNGILFASGFPGLGSANQVVFAILTVGGTATMVVFDVDRLGLALAWVYVGSAGGFAVTAYVALAVRKRMRLPLVRTCLLLLPLLLAWPAQSWDAPLLLRCLTLLGFVGGYAATAIRFGLVPAAEIHQVLRRSWTPTPSRPTTASSDGR